MDKTKFIADCARETFNRLKPWNKRLEKARNRAEKDEIVKEIKAEHNVWLAKVAPTFNDIYQQRQEEHLAAMQRNFERLNRGEE